MKKMTRLESSKECRRVLNRHGADLSYLQYTCTGFEVRLTGWLCKVDSSDFNGGQVEAMINDFKKTLTGFSVYGDLDNWNFTSDHISYIGDKHFGSGEEGQEVYEIDLDDYDFEAS